MSTVLKVGIATVPEQRARFLAIAAGRRARGGDEPNVWFPSVASMARVLSDENMAHGRFGPDWTPVWKLDSTR